jgi:hypothetical protein
MMSEWRARAIRCSPLGPVVPANQYFTVRSRAPVQRIDVISGLIQEFVEVEATPPKVAASEADAHFEILVDTDFYGGDIAPISFSRGVTLDECKSA